MMTMMIDTSTAVRFLPSANFFCCSTAAVPQHVRSWKLVESGNFSSADFSPRRLLRSAAFQDQTPLNNCRRLNAPSLLRRTRLIRNRILATASDPSKQNERQRYHPSEDIAEPNLDTSGDATLTAQETARTIVEVNSKATLMLTGLIQDEFHENIIWPDLPYVTDEHGNIYFQVKNDEDILQTLTSENNFVQVIVGFDAMEMLNEMESLGQSEMDFGIEEIEDEDSDAEDDDDEDEDEDEDGDYDEDLVAVLDNEGDSDDSDETLGDWAKLDTMRSSHPMYFAKKISQVASDDPINWMDQPPAGLAFQGLIRPAFIEEQSDIQRYISDSQSRRIDINQFEENVEDLDLINGHKHELESSEDSSIWAEELESNEVSQIGTSFYKLEIMKIDLISALGRHTTVEVEDFRMAQPDAIALSAAKIISRLKAGGEKMTQALKSLCSRCKGVQVEEAAIISVDSLGFDSRVCSGTQIQTLRFAFATRATSEYSAERQLNDLLFPRIQNRTPKKKQTHQNEL